MARSSYLKNFQLSFSYEQLAHSFKFHLDVEVGDLGTRGKKYESVFLIRSRNPRTRLYEEILKLVESEDEYLSIWMNDYSDGEDLCLVLETLPEDIAGKVNIRGTGLLDCDKAMVILGKHPSGDKFFVKTAYPFCGSYEPKVL